MGAHLKIVDTADLAGPPPVRSPAPEHPRSQHITRKLTVNDVIVALIAGVLAVWIID